MAENEASVRDIWKGNSLCACSTAHTKRTDFPLENEITLACEQLSGDAGSKDSKVVESSTDAVWAFPEDAGAEVTGVECVKDVEHADAFRASCAEVAVAEEGGVESVGTKDMEGKSIRITYTEDAGTVDMNKSGIWNNVGGDDDHDKAPILRPIVSYADMRPNSQEQKLDHSGAKLLVERSFGRELDMVPNKVESEKVEVEIENLPVRVQGIKKDTSGEVRKEVSSDMLRIKNALDGNITLLEELKGQELNVIHSVVGNDEMQEKNKQVSSAEQFDSMIMAGSSGSLLEDCGNESMSREDTEEIGKTLCSDEDSNNEGLLVLGQLADSLQECEDRRAVLETSSNCKMSTESSDSSDDWTSSPDSLDLTEKDRGGQVEEQWAKKAREKNVGLTSSIGDQLLCDMGLKACIPTPVPTPLTLPKCLKLQPVGVISSLFLPLVVVESLPGVPPLNEGSILFTDNCIPIATIFETFGPVIRPYYSLHIGTYKTESEQPANTDENGKEMTKSHVPSEFVGTRSICEKKHQRDVFQEETGETHGVKLETDIKEEEIGLAGERSEMLLQIAEEKTEIAETMLGMEEGQGKDRHEGIEDLSSPALNELGLENEHEDMKLKSSFAIAVSSEEQNMENIGEVNNQKVAVEKEYNYVDHELVVGQTLNYAPGLASCTQTVFTERLFRDKGSDASWKNDLEPPMEMLDYSDDEQERAVRRAGHAPCNVRESNNAHSQTNVSRGRNKKMRNRKAEGQQETVESTRSRTSNVGRQGKTGYRRTDGSRSVGQHHQSFFNLQEAQPQVSQIPGLPPHSICPPSSPWPTSINNHFQQVIPSISPRFRPTALPLFASPSQQPSPSLWPTLPPGQLPPPSPWSKMHLDQQPSPFPWPAPPLCQPPLPFPWPAPPCGQKRKPSYLSAFSRGQQAPPLLPPTLPFRQQPPPLPPPTLPHQQPPPLPPPTLPLHQQPPPLPPPTLPLRQQPPPLPWPTLPPGQKPSASNWHTQVGHHPQPSPLLALFPGQQPPPSPWFTLPQSQKPLHSPRPFLPPGQQMLPSPQRVLPLGQQAQSLMCYPLPARPQPPVSTWPAP